MAYRVAAVKGVGGGERVVLKGVLVGGFLVRNQSSRRKLTRHLYLTEVKGGVINFRPLTPPDVRFAYHGGSLKFYDEGCMCP